MSYLGLFCHFIKDKNGSKFSQIEAVRLEGVDPPSPPKAVSLTAFSQFFYAFPKLYEQFIWEPKGYLAKCLIIYSFSSTHYPGEATEDPFSGFIEHRLETLLNVQKLQMSLGIHILSHCQSRSSTFQSIIGFIDIAFTNLL